MALAASGLYLYSNKYFDPNDFGAVRVGRAVATVGFLIWGVAEDLQYYLQVFILVTGRHAGHTFVEMHMYPCMCRPPSLQLLGHGVHPHAPVVPCAHTRPS